MIACDFVVVALIAQGLSRTVDVAWPETGPLPVACPVGQATSIVFPEPLDGSRRSDRIARRSPSRSNAPHRPPWS